MKLFVYKTVTCEVIKVEFLSRDLVLNNSAIMVKRKCLKLLYSSKAMCGIESQFKKMIHLKYLVLETPYTFFSIFSWYFSFTFNIVSPMFSGFVFEAVFISEQVAENRFGALLEITNFSPSLMFLAI